MKYVCACNYKNNENYLVYFSWKNIIKSDVIDRQCVTEKA